MVIRMITRIVPIKRGKDAKYFNCRDIAACQRDRVILFAGVCVRRRSEW